MLPTPIIFIPSTEVRNLFYSLLLSCKLNIINKPSETYLYTAHKLSARFPIGPVYRKTQEEVLNTSSYTIQNNPFAEGQPFQVTGGEGIEVINAVLYSLDGRMLYQWSGKLQELNHSIASEQWNLLSNGCYQLILRNDYSAPQTFKLIKN
jgi:hypothetical protein